MGDEGAGGGPLEETLSVPLSVPLRSSQNPNATLSDVGCSCRAPVEISIAPECRSYNRQAVTFLNFPPELHWCQILSCFLIFFSNANPLGKNKASVEN